MSSKTSKTSGRLTRGDADLQPSWFLRARPGDGHEKSAIASTAAGDVTGRILTTVPLARDRSEGRRRVALAVQILAAASRLRPFGPFRSIAGAHSVNARASWGWEKGHDRKTGRARVRLRPGDRLRHHASRAG